MNGDGKKAGPRLECTVKTGGFCCGAACALHGVCPHEKAILDSAEAEGPQ